MREAEFEEKDFEAPLYNQLLFGSHNIATPGQVFEGKFGIDAALQALHPQFWELFGYPHAPKGVHLSDFKWGFVWRRLGRKRILPNFSVNLLLQSKRPSVLERARGNLNRLGLHGPFWRFVIKDHQQEILEKITQRLDRKALVIYASPAFNTLDLLYEYTQNQKIVENSSFVKVNRMTGHRHWNYNCPGTQGVASSEPELIEDTTFEDLLKELLEAYDPEANVEEGIFFLHKTTFVICQELSGENPLARFIMRINERITEIAQRMEIGFPYITAFINLLYTFGILKVAWLPIAAGSELARAPEA